MLRREGRDRSRNGGLAPNRRYWKNLSACTTAQRESRWTIPAGILPFDRLSEGKGSLKRLHHQNAERSLRNYLRGFREERIE
jgi:hypothetical protein